ncbi:MULTISPECIES: hypothetical protein [unclassified Kitasatospora]|uniref:hypothetical protein n=1 Tax=unclassified Kitasatospora TaxID=2633591 RepID=UPI0033CB4238
MPRNRPRALRAEGTTRGPSPRSRDCAPPSRIHGLSTRTSLAVHRLEERCDSFYLHPGATDRALRRYRTFLHPPGRRPLYPQESMCPSCPGCAFDDVRHARDVLDAVLERLPPRPRTELARLVRPLDVALHRRTLPDPFAHRRPWRAEYWWHRRLGDPARG